MLEVSCPRCKGKHTIEVTWSEDSAGRPRISYRCPVKKTKVSSFPPRGASSKTKEAAMPARKRATKTTGASVRSLAVSIPMEVESGPQIHAAWDIGEGLLDGLRELSSQAGAGSLQIEAAAAFQRAKGETSEADSTEYTFGRALAQAVAYVAAHRGMSPAEWAALAPEGLGSGGAGASGVLGSLSSSLPGIDLGGADLVDTAAGAVGAAAATAVGLPPAVGAAGGRLAADTVQTLFGSE